MATPFQEFLSPPVRTSPNAEVVQRLDQFANEAELALARVQEISSAGKRSPVASAHVEEMLRIFHALKVVARSLDARDLGRVSHAVEGLLTDTRQGHLPITDEMLNVLDGACDSVQRLVKRLRLAAKTGLAFAEDHDVASTLTAINLVRELTHRFGSAEHTESSRHL